ncbi:hypothetical protein U2I54_28260, partial [Bacillus pseudomycoides]|nr:hypothetical protein [Bacillus pseudomycoides]
AYLVKLKGNHRLVIRFPKKQAYGKSVSFNWQEMFSEYSGNGLYYQQANAVMPGICPEEYEFHVDPELTYIHKCNIVNFNKLLSLINKGVNYGLTTTNSIL